MTASWPKASSLPESVNKLMQQLIDSETLSSTVPANWKPVGLKYDDNKPRMDLLDPEFTIGVANVLTFGARKYAADNWRGGISYTRILSSIHRHLAAIQRGEDIDPESGQPHVYHIACNCQFLGWFMKYKPELDDRWKN